MRFRPVDDLKSCNRAYDKYHMILATCPQQPIVRAPDRH